MPIDRFKITFTSSQHDLTCLNLTPKDLFKDIQNPYKFFFRIESTILSEINISTLNFTTILKNKRHSQEEFYKFLSPSFGKKTTPEANMKFYLEGTYDTVYTKVLLI